MITPREIMVRCIESISSSGVREPQRLLKDARILYEAVMALPGEEAPKAKPGRRTKAPTDEAPEA